MKKYLIACLGNIGAEYANTRHNIGFMVADTLAKIHNVTFRTQKLGDLTEIKVKGRTKTFYLNEPQRQSGTLLDGKREYSVRKPLGNYR